MPIRTPTTLIHTHSLFIYPDLTHLDIIYIPTWVYELARVCSDGANLHRRASDIPVYSPFLGVQISDFLILGSPWKRLNLLVDGWG